MYVREREIERKKERERGTQRVLVSQVCRILQLGAAALKLTRATKTRAKTFPAISFESFRHLNKLLLTFSLRGSISRVVSNC